VGNINRCLSWKQGFKDVSSFCRHPSAHEYYDPNDYRGDVHQEMDREELELEVGSVSFVSFEESLLSTQSVS
jgi:hypothetical protein